MKQLRITSNVHSFLDELPPKTFRQIVKKIFALLKNPLPTDSKPLKGYPYQRTDIGEYRIIYRFDCDTLYVILIGKRNDDEVYKKIKQMI